MLRTFTINKFNINRQSLLVNTVDHVKLFLSIRSFWYAYILYAFMLFHRSNISAELFYYSLDGTINSGCTSIILKPFVVIILLLCLTAFGAIFFYIGRRNKTLALLSSVHLVIIIHFWLVIKILRWIAWHWVYPITDPLFTN